MESKVSSSGTRAPSTTPSKSKAGIGKSAGAVGEADQGKHRARGPDFGIRRAGGFERGERQDDVADRAGADQQGRPSA